MRSFSKVLGSWEFWTMVALFALSILLMSTIEAVAVYKDTLWPALGIIPVAVIWYIVFVKPTRK
jgi:hypothetical protein